MLANRSIGIRTLTLLCQLVIVTLSYWGWLFIWESSFFEGSAELQHYTLYNEFLLIGILFGLRNKREVSGPSKDWVIANRKSVQQAILGLFSVFLIVFALKDTLISRSFFFSYLPWLYSSLLFTNFWLPRSLGHWAFSGVREERVALAGTSENVGRIKQWLDRKSVMGLKTVGLVSTEPCSGTASPVPVLGTLDQMGDILRVNGITQLIVLDLSAGSERLRYLTQLCEDAAVRLVVVHDLNSYFNHNTIVFEDDGVRFIGLREEPLESPLNRVAKRMLDITVAALVVFLILPFTNLLVWVLQRFYSPGPLYYRQVRNGMLGRPFRIYKYRTMHVDNDNEDRQAAKNDSRVFPAGAWLRKLSIDELPQFINVLLGEMSIVGPRPHLPKHDEMFVKVMRNYLIRRFIRPGITGWAQVNGFRGEIHNESDIQNRVRADIHYLEHWSFSLDCLILLKTVRHCIFPPQTAY
jgi:exopolysaccharide biosynthesis polyprenyl glycosylphosphotransferase